MSKYASYDDEDVDDSDNDEDERLPRCPDCNAPLVAVRSAGASKNAPRDQYVCRNAIGEQVLNPYWGADDTRKHVFPTGSTHKAPRTFFVDDEGNLCEWVGMTNGRSKTIVVKEQSPR